MKKILLSFSAILISCLAFAQQNVIKGKVLEINKINLVPATTISLLKSKDSAIVKTGFADAAGNFSLENVKTGSYILMATAVGYEKTFSIPIEINETNQQQIVQALFLKPVDKSLALVTVVAKKPFIERKLDRTIINVESSITSAGSTAMEVLEKSPGVAVDKDGKISLKGKQGVIVLIDGKQTYMGAQDLANYLQSMPASNLEQIELLPNPSAKYDASGNSGVINIKTKRNKQKGFNGSIKNTLAFGKYPRTFNTLNLNYKNGKFNVFSSIGVNYRKNFQVLTINRKYMDYSGTTNAIFDQSADFIKTNYNKTARLGVDFFASKKTTIGVLATGYLTNGTQDGTNTSFLKDGAGTVNSILSSTNEEKKNFKNGGLNVNLRHTFDSTGREISVDIDALKYKSIQHQFFNSQNYTPLWVKQSSEDLKADLPATINVYCAKVDYMHPFKNGLKMETGIKTSFVNTDNLAGYFNIINDVSQVDNEKTNHFKYNENINAGYVNFSKEYKKWSLQTGLRLENTNYKGNQFGNPIKADSSFKKSYTGLFPTMFAGYKLNSKNEFGFSYGRRISRPDYESLNPFIFFIDKYTYEAGNPFLKPMYANVFELSHTYNKFLTSNLNYTHSKDMFNEYFEQSGYATIVKENNYGNIYDISLSLNAEIKPAKWWTLMPYAEFNYNAVNSQLNGFTLRTSGTGFNLNMNNQFTFNKGWSAELSGFYRSKMNRGQFNIGEVKQLSTGVSKQIFKKKGSVKFYLSDIFNSGNQKGVINIQNTVASFTQKRDNRTAGVTFNYKFGKPLKMQQRKSGGASAEESRIKAG